ncbi:hypothetical protein OHB54_06220 [Streptomyces sp. NBC_01007]|nr:hypothetical protein OHB54_06220 [Streptomyces sp. NBC_01007]
MTTPDLLDTWSVRIAEWAAPEETTFAAQTARAYAAGGTPCRHLFSSPGRAPGGMGGGAVSVLPAVLDGLAYAAESLKSALGSSELNNLLSATGLLVGLRAQRRADAASRRRGEPGTGVSEDVADDAARLVGDARRRAGLAAGHRRATRTAGPDGDGPVREGVRGRGPVSGGPPVRRAAASRLPPARRRVRRRPGGADRPGRAGAERRQCPCRGWDWDWDWDWGCG